MTSPTVGSDPSRMRTNTATASRRPQGQQKSSPVSGEQGARAQCQQSIGDLSPERLGCGAGAFRVGANELAARGIADQRRQMQAALGFHAERGDWNLAAAFQTPRNGAFGADATCGVGIV